MQYTHNRATQTAEIPCNLCIPAVDGVGLVLLSPKRVATNFVCLETFKA